MIQQVTVSIALMDQSLTSSESKEILLLFELILNLLEFPTKLLITTLELHTQGKYDAYLMTWIGLILFRWATHGVPSDTNSHPHRSDTNNEFVAVHNGIITNYRELKEKLEKKGFKFESETDTECIRKY